MEELNSSRLLQEISSKLPSYSGSRCCRHARDKLKKTENAVSFHDLVEFVKEEADLANDPIFSPEALKRKRNKEVEKQRFRRRKVPDASTFASMSSNNENKAKPTERPTANGTSQSKFNLQNQHTAIKSAQSTQMRTKLLIPTRACVVLLAGAVA